MMLCNDLECGCFLWIKLWKLWIPVSSCHGNGVGALAADGCHDRALDDEPTDGSTAVVGVG